MNKILSLPPVKQFDRLKHFYTSVALWSAAVRVYPRFPRLAPPHYPAYRAAVSVWRTRYIKFLLFSLHQRSFPTAMHGAVCSLVSAT